MKSGKAIVRIIICILLTYFIFILNIVLFENNNEVGFFPPSDTLFVNLKTIYILCKIF